MQTTYNHSLVSSIFHNGYRAEDAKNIGKITKFITPAKFSSCLIAEDRNIPKAPSISPETIKAGKRDKYPKIGGFMSQNEAINRNA